MKLVMEDASPWPLVVLPSALPIAEPAPTVAKRELELAVVTRPLDPLLNFWGPWKQAMLDWGKPQGGKVDVVTETKSKTECEWEVEIIDSLVKDVEGKVVE